MAKTSISAAATERPRLWQRYEETVLPGLMKQFSIRNRLAAPRLVKVVVNIGCGEAAHEAKVLEEAQQNLGIITGQKPLMTRAKKAISNFRIKEGDPVGCKVTLRRTRMYEFFDRLVSTALPRIRDFRGLSAKGFDGYGNYSFGIADVTIFPELHPDDLHYPLGMDVTVVTTAATVPQARALLEAFGVPFEKPSPSQPSSS